MFFRNLKWDIVGQRNIWFGVSGIIIIAGIIALFIHHGLPLGLSFTGGSTIDVKFNQSVTEEQVHAALAKMDVNAIDAGDRDSAKQTQIRAEYADIISGAETLQLATKSGDIAPNDRITISTQGAISDPSPIYDTLDKAGFKVDRAQSQNTAVGPSLSKEYLQRSLLALVIALGLQLLYIAFRFGNQLRFGVIADIALLHDVIVMVGIYALANRKADDAFLAALLTVIGYSVMDSIVIFDRIRENGRIMADQPYDKMVNVSLLQTMTRSVYTLATVLIVLFALYFFGGDTLKNFAFALLVGVTSGAYSSIFIASPLLVMWQQRTARARAGAHAAALARESSTRQTPATQRTTQSASRAAETAERAKRAKAKTPAGPPPRYRRMRDRVPASASADGGDDAGTERSDFENGADAGGADEAR